MLAMVFALGRSACAVGCRGGLPDREHLCAHRLLYRGHGPLLPKYQALAVGAGRARDGGWRGAGY